MLKQCNPYVQVFLQAKDVIDARPALEVHMRIRTDFRGLDKRRYNAPTVADVAVIMNGDGETPGRERDIVVKKRTGELQRIKDTARFQCAMRYFSEGGWNFCI